MNSGKSERHFANCNILDLSVEQKVVKYFKPIQVIIHLEGSGKWPNDLEAFLRVKGTFYLEIKSKAVPTIRFNHLWSPRPCGHLSEWVDIQDYYRVV